MGAEAKEGARARSGCDGATAPGEEGTVATAGDWAREGASPEAGSVKAEEVSEVTGGEDEESSVREGGTARHPVGVGDWRRKVAAGGRTDS